MKKNAPLKKIFFAVMAVHMIFILVYARADKKPKRFKKLMVHHFVQENQPSISPKPSPVKNTALKKNIPPKPKAKKVVPSKAKENTSAILEDLQKKLQNLEKKEEIQTTALTVPAAIVDLHVDMPKDLPTSMETTYEETLIHHLQQALELPEQGEVKIRIRLKHDGTVLDLQILKAQSNKNLIYLKNTLPGLIFPCFNDCKSLGDEREFTLCFRNQS